MKTISIDPRANLVYASMYIKGLQEYFGNHNVTFHTTPFLNLKQTDGLEDFDHYFSFLNHQTNKKYVVDYRDKNTLNQRALEWSDVYAKVNLNTREEFFAKLHPTKKKKIIGIGPNFGIKLYSDNVLYVLAILNYLKAAYRLTLPVGFRTYLSGYNWMRKRQQIKYCESSHEIKNYVFHVSSFYQNQAHGDKTNELRAAFIRACKNTKGLKFEGGLLSKSGILKHETFSDVIIDYYVRNSDYVLKTRQSKAVFNTPAAWGCHGWKLGEYFAMGKAIISTPFINDVPEGITHGENIHMIDSRKILKKS